MTDNKDSQGKDKQKKININCPEAIANGKYSNLFITNISKEELIIDFAMMYPHTNQATVQSRVVLTHGNAKKLYDLLGKHIKDFEKENGEGPGQGIRFSIN